MRRLASLTLALLLASTSTACGGKDDEVDPAKAKKDQEAKDAKKGGNAEPAATTVPVTDPSDDPPQAPQDRSCDPKDKGACLEGETCIGTKGCEAVWECDDKVTCKKGMREYCGCDGKTFEAEYGNCPTQKYQYEGPCK